MYTNKKLSKIFAMAVAALCSPVAVAWDGVSTGKIEEIHVSSPASNYGFRITLAGGGALCSGGTAEFAYLNESDSNYKVFVGILMAAQAQNLTVSIFTTLEGQYCHIGYVVARRPS